MARLHIRFREDDIDPRLLELTARFFQARPWLGDDLIKHRKFETWLHGACTLYRLPPVTLSVMPIQQKGPTYGEYDADGPGILLRRFSVISLFHQFRHHMQANSTDEWNHDNDGADAQAWACSLFYIIRPKKFRRWVRRGRVAGVYPPDLLKKKRR